MTFQGSDDDGVAPARLGRETTSRTTASTSAAADGHSTPSYQQWRVNSPVLFTEETEDLFAQFLMLIDAPPPSNCYSEAHRDGVS